MRQVAEFEGLGGVEADADGAEVLLHGCFGGVGRGVAHGDGPEFADFFGWQGLEVAGQGKGGSVGFGHFFTDAGAYVLRLTGSGGFTDGELML